MMLRIVDVAMIASLENDIVKSNIERVLFVLQNMLLFCSNEHLHMIVGWIARVKRWFEKAWAIIDDALCHFLQMR